LAFCAVVVVAGALAWPAEAQAQRRAVRAARAYRPAYRPVVVVRTGFYYGRPYFYDPFYWGGWYQYPYPYRYPYYWDNRASLRIQVTPREAEVFVDGYFVGRVDDFDGWSQRLDVDPGEHEIQIYLQGYRTIREKMLFRPREGYKIQRAMEPIATGDPAEARPSPTGQPPERGGYARDPRDRGQPPDERRRVPVAARERDDASGAISIRVQPDDAIVIIDGERWDRPEGESRLVVDLAEGPHRVEVQREGHRPFTTTVQVRRGEVTTLNVSLPR
jgi:hypothetical protein